MAEETNKETIAGMDQEEEMNAASEQETHPYVAMMFLVGDECEKKSFHGLTVEDAPEGLFLVNDVVLNQYDENGALDMALSIMKASESFVEFINKTNQYEFDCGKGTFYEEHIFSEKWFEQGGVPEEFKIWVPILKNDQLQSRITEKSI